MGKTNWFQIQIKKIKLFFIYRKFEKSEIYKNAKIKFKLGSNFYKLGLEFDNSFEKIITKNKYLFDILEDILKKNICSRSDIICRPAQCLLRQHLRWCRKIHCPDRRRSWDHRKTFWHWSACHRCGIFFPKWHCPFKRKWCPWNLLLYQYRIDRKLPILWYRLWEIYSGCLWELAGGKMDRCLSSGMAGMYSFQSRRPGTEGCGRLFCR